MKHLKFRIFFGIVFVLSLGLVLVQPAFSKSKITKTIYEVNFDNKDLTLKKFEGYHTAELSGCTFMREVGKPRLPVKVIHLAVGPNQEIHQIKLIEDVAEEVPGKFIIYPAQESARYGTKRKFTPADPVVYGSAQAFPSEKKKVKTNGSLSGIDLSTIHVYPLEYIPKEKKLIFHKKMRFEVTYKEKVSDKNFKKPKKRSQKSSRKVKRLLKKIVANPYDVDGIYADSGTLTLEDETQVKTLGEDAVVTSSVADGIIDYLIITNNELKTSGAFDSLINRKSAKGLAVGVETVEAIQSNVVGRDLAEKIRNYIKDKFINNGLTWVLLGGDTNIVPSRCVLDQGEMGDFCDGVLSDMYYSDLDGDWDANGDSRFGNFDDGLDLYPDVFVGRAPVRNTTEAQTFSQKVLTYEKNVSAYYDQAAFFGALDFDDAGGTSKDHIDVQYLPADFQVDKYYERDLGVYRQQAINAVNQGYHLINHIDHADWDRMYFGGDGSEPPEQSMLTISDVNSFQNDSALSIIWSCGCWPAAIDRDAIAENWINNPNGGAVAFVGNTRYGLNPESDLMLDPNFYKALFEQGFTRIGETLANSKIDFIPEANNQDSSMRYAMLELLLLGDPEMEIVLVPGTKINEPINEGIISGSVNISGDAYGDQFDHYEVWYATQIRPNVRTLITSSTTPVQNGILASWNTNIAIDGRYFLTLESYDTTGGVRSQTIEVIVNNSGNLPPSFNPINIGSYNPGDHVEFMISATDPEGGYLSFTAELENGDSLSTVGASLTDHGDGTATFAWDIPVNETNSSLGVKFFVSDNHGLGDIENVSIGINQKGRIVSPAAGALLNNWEVSFEWAKSSSDLLYGVCLYHGAEVVGCYPHDEPTSATRQTAWINLDGKPVIAKLFECFVTEDGGYCESIDEKNYGVALATASNLTDPLEGQVIESSSINFEWNEGVGVTQKALAVGTSPGMYDIFVQGVEGNSITVNDIPLGSAGSPRTIYVSLISEFLNPEYNEVKEYAFQTQAPNQNPILDLIGSKNIDENQPLNFTISATDPDGDTLNFSVSDLPSGAGFSDHGNGTATFSWTPDYSQAGTYAVTFTVSDGGLEDSETINIVVNDKKPVANGPVKVEGRKLMSDFDGDGVYEPFFIKGAGYNPIPIGRNPSDWGYPAPDPRIDNYFDDPAILTRDFQWLKDMNANTIRIWKGNDTEDAAGRFPAKLTQNTLDKAGEYGLKVIAGFWLDWAGHWKCEGGESVFERNLYCIVDACGDWNPPWTHPQDYAEINYSDENYRNKVKADFRAYVESFKFNPNILFWAIGNENNYHLPNESIERQDFFSLINELIEIVYSVEGDQYHPVAVVLGEIVDIPEAESYLGNVDIWGANVYRGSSFGTLFDEFESITAKPLWISEYGVDAWYTNDVDNPGDGYEDQETQAEWTENLLFEIGQNNDVCIGGTAMEYSDEWWKPAEWQNDFSHDQDGFGPQYQLCPPEENPVPQPSQDGYFNEEYWGIMSIPEDQDPSQLNEMEPRAVYAVLQKGFKEPVKISSCQELTEPSTTYTLTEDLGHDEPVTDKCLWIRNGSITLDCQGHSIIAPNLSGSAIYVGGWRANVKNCNLIGPTSGTYNSSNGIASYWAKYGLIENNTITGFGTGILIHGDSNTVDHNIVENSIKAIHVRLNGNIVKNNLVRNNTRGQGWGLASWDGPNARFINNKVYGNRYGNVLSYAENSEVRCDQYSSNSSKDIFAYNGSTNVALNGVTYTSKYSSSNSGFVETPDACTDLDCAWNGDVCE